MEHLLNSMAENRAHTDASLGAERAGADAASVRSAARTQRILDDLIERDRIRADDRLFKFRQEADGMLARERLASPRGDESLVIERQTADADKRRERHITDALLDGERHRADAATKTERRELGTDQASMALQRQDTNDQLSTERTQSDGAATDLAEAKGALFQSLGARARGNDVLGMVAHDLRSPLSVIAMNSECIVELSAEGPTREAAQDVILAAARMERILADLLDVVRIESGGLRITKRPHDVGKLVSEILQTYQPLFVRRGLNFRAVVPSPAVTVSFDHDRIVQVLSNLLGNAMKFTPGDGTVDLHVEQQTDHVEFVLRDSGTGITAAALPNIFKRFWQIDDQGRRGLGLGLHICEQLVVGHGGRIWAESEPGKGATFRFTLPS